MSYNDPGYSSQNSATIGSVLLHEAAFGRSRGEVTVLAGSGATRPLTLGHVLGRSTLGAPTITPNVGNTGNGVLGTLTFGDQAKVGAYTLTCIAVAANAGTFKVVDPDGYRLDDAEVAVAYASPQVNFTVADGAADFILADSITIDIAVGADKVVALDLTATDGTQLADSVLLSSVTAPDGSDVTAPAAVRETVLHGPGLIWPVGITAGQKTVALAALAANGTLVSGNV